VDKPIAEDVAVVKLVDVVLPKARERVDDAAVLVAEGLEARRVEIVVFLVVHNVLQWQE